MNVISQEGERTSENAICLCVISVHMAGRYPTFISPPQVNARPIHAFFPEVLLVGGTEVLENPDSDGAARECNVRPFLLLENLNKETSSISGNARDDVRFVDVNNQGAVRQRLCLRYEGEPLGHHIAVDHIGIESAKL